MFAYCSNNSVNMIDSNGEDAILIVDTGEYGVPLVGHSRVYFQDEEGVWYVTEVAGQFPYPWTAYVYFEKVSESRYNSEFENMMNGKPMNNISSIYLEGDFTKAKGIAEASQKKVFYYDLLLNSCHHYSVKILAKGQFSDPAVEKTVSLSTTIIPTAFLDHLRYAQSTGHVPGTGYIYNEGEWENYPWLAPPKLF